MKKTWLETWQFFQWKPIPKYAYNSALQRTEEKYILSKKQVQCSMFTWSSRAHDQSTCSKKCHAKNVTKCHTKENNPWQLQCTHKKGFCVEKKKEKKKKEKKEEKLLVLVSFFVGPDFSLPHPCYRSVGQCSELDWNCEFAWTIWSFRTMFTSELSVHSGRAENIHLWDV